jgi:hypothetical protein
VNDLFTVVQTIVMASTLVVLVLMAYTHARMWWLARHPGTRKTWLPRINR